MATAGAIRALTNSREKREVPGVACNYTAHMFSIQVKCYLGDVAETRVRTAVPLPLRCVVRVAAVAKVRLFFLYATRLRSGGAIMGTNGCGPWAFPGARPVLRHGTRLCAESTGSAWKPSWALGRRVSWGKHPVLGTKGRGGSGRQDAPGQPEAGSTGRASPLGLCPAPWPPARWRARPGASGCVRPTW